jgi:hypothetical protein
MAAMITSSTSILETRLLPLLPHLPQPDLEPERALAGRQRTATGKGNVVGGKNPAQFDMTDVDSTSLNDEWADGGEQDAWSGYLASTTSPMEQPQRPVRFVAATGLQQPPAQPAQEAKGKGKNKGKGKGGGKAKGKPRQTAAAAGLEHGGQHMHTRAQQFVLPAQFEPLRPLLVDLLKSTTQLQARMRKVLPMVCDPFQLDLQHPVMQAYHAEWQKYIEWTYTLPSRREAPPPHAFTVPSMLGALAGLDVGAKNKQALGDFVQELLQMEDYERALLLNGCEVEPMADKTWTWLYLGTTNLSSALRSVVVQSMKQTGAIHVPGKVPPGYLEGSLSSYITSLTSY